MPRLSASRTRCRRRFGDSAVLVGLGFLLLNRPTRGSSLAVAGAVAELDGQLAERLPLPVRPRRAAARARLLGGLLRVRSGFLALEQAHEGSFLRGMGAGGPAAPAPGHPRG